VTATSTDGGLSDPVTLAVTVAAVADAPTLDVVNVSGDEDTAIALDISAALTDLDGSETLSDVTLSGIPEGSVISVGADGQGNLITVAVVNGEPLYVKELNKALAVNLKRDPLSHITPQSLKTYVDLLIDKKLLIQQARKSALDQAERFVDTIKTFWEQTLIRELITLKNNEFDNAVTVSDEAISDYYNKLSRQITCKIAKNAEPATPKQKQFMKKLNIQFPSNVTKHEASVLIDDELGKGGE